MPWTEKEIKEILEQESKSKVNIPTKAEKKAAKKFMEKMESAGTFQPEPKKDK